MYLADIYLSARSVPRDCTESGRPTDGNICPCFLYLRDLFVTFLYGSAAPPVSHLLFMTANVLYKDMERMERVSKYNESPYVAVFFVSYIINTIVKGGSNLNNYIYHIFHFLSLAPHLSSTLYTTSCLFLNQTRQRKERIILTF